MKSKKSDKQKDGEGNKNVSPQMAPKMDSPYYFSVEVPARPRDAKPVYTSYKGRPTSKETNLVIARSQSGRELSREVETREFDRRSNRTTAYFYSLSKDVAHSAPVMVSPELFYYY